MGAPEIERFLTHLAVNRHVAASTQNQALNALVFLYKQVLEIELGEMGNITPAKRLQLLPIVFRRTGMVSGQEPAETSMEYDRQAWNQGRCRGNGDSGESKTIGRHLAATPEIMGIAIC